MPGGEEGQGHGERHVEEGPRADDFEEGDHVTWNSHGSQAEGGVQRKITSDAEAAGRTVRGSQDQPQYEVKSEKGGGTAVHTPGALHED